MCERVYIISVLSKIFEYGLVHSKNHAIDFEIDSLRQVRWTMRQSTMDYACAIQTRASLFLYRLKP